MRRIIIGLCFGILCTSPAYAGSFGVAPTTLTLSAGTKTGVMYVTNHGTTPMVAQIEGFDWQQKDNADVLEPSSTLMISPPMVKLAPKQQQTVRFAIKPGTDDTAERTYRLMVSELPDHSATSKVSTIQMLLQFSVPLFVEGTNPAQRAIAWDVQHSDTGMALVARNTGTKTVKLSGVTVSSASAQQTEIAPKTFNYLLPGAAHQWQVDAMNLSSTDTLHIKAHEDRDGAAIDTTAFVRK